MCLRNGNCDSVILPIHRLSKTLPYNVAFWGGPKLVQAISHCVGAQEWLSPWGQHAMSVERQGKPQHRSRGEGGKQSDAAHLHITSLSTHQKRPLESDFSEVPE